MTETQMRIKALKASLPGLKERVLAVALLLIMSAAMMTSATYAWLTISLRPELTGVNTSVTANGNLEIALATGEKDTVRAPGESQVGDSSAAEGQSIVKSNITWGNLVNLSDRSYGLDKLVLRPAQLNTAALLTSPLYGAVYNADGRISQLSSEFGYAIWVPPTEDKPGYFGISDQLGVRAISSTTVEAVGAEAIYHNMLTGAKNKNLAAANSYVALGNNDKYMPSLATMMGLYMTARMNSDHETLSNPECAIEDIQNLRDMYAAFLDAFDQEAEAIAALANLQLFLQHGEGNYTPYTAERIYATTAAKLKGEGIQISDLDQFIKDRNIIASDLEKLKEIAASGTSLKWKDSGLNSIVNNLVNVGACTIGADNTPISSIGASNAMSYLSGTQEARITNGILYRFEERTGGYIEVKNLGISATVNRMGMTIPATVKANIQTTAPREYNLFANDVAYSESLNKGDYKGGIPVAEDTYGLAVDLWVRTNAANSHLTLEGNLVTESEIVRATAKDPNGNTVELYTVTISQKSEDGTTVSYSIDVYEAMGPVFDEDGNPVIDESTGKQKEEMMWYNAETHTRLSDEALNGQTPMEKMVEVITVVGYEGENRVWNGNNMLSTDATTQGSGSCYVYYADTPEDQARSLELLKAFNVAFVDEEGKLLATAIMDTEHYYARDGRVTVPLILDPGNSINLGEDYEGNVTYAITTLEKNVPKRITAIVYLDGTKLNNDQVLSAADIQGQLNIQFGSSADLNVIKNEELANKERKISVTLDKTSFDFDTHTGDMTTKVTVHVDGDVPANVTAFFVRRINATQGTREETMVNFRKDDATGDWVDSYTFTSPGEYVLRSVTLDGVEYVLNKPQTVKIEGFAVTSLTSGEGNRVKAMTAENAVSVDLKLRFAADDVAKMPSTVQGRYLRADGTAVNVNFVYKDGEWVGTATFVSSGEYTLQYLLLDGNYTELNPTLWQYADVTLGMRVEVYTTSPHTFKYVPSEMKPNEKLLAMQVKLLDNAGNEMPGLSGVKLTYNMKGSGVKKMDTDLVWNGSYYVGELKTEGPGIWQFGSVDAGGYQLTAAITSPTFTVQSPEPPEYYDHGTSSYQYAPNNNATMNVRITNSSAAAVQAYIIKNGDAEGTWVDGIIGADLTTEDDKPANNWNFKVPTDANGYQDGNWTLTRIRMWNVFAADGTEYTEDAPLEFDVSDTNNVTKVVARIYVNFAPGQAQNFGINSEGKVEGAFMDSYTLSGLTVMISDFEGPLKDVSNVKIDYIYAGDSLAKGGYSGGNVPSGGVTAFTVQLDVDPNDPTKFVQKGTQNVQFAGTYNPKLSFSFYDDKSKDNNVTSATYEGKTLPADAPVITVNSVVPTVKITEASYASASSQTAATFTDTSTTIYAHEYIKEVPFCGQTFRYKKYHQPYVIITLSGYGNATGATLTFTKDGGGTVLLYEVEEGQKAVSAFVWSGNGPCKRWVGTWNENTDDDDRTTAGKLLATTLVISYGGVDYNVAAPITINNPN